MFASAMMELKTLTAFMAIFASVSATSHVNEKDTTEIFPTGSSNNNIPRLEKRFPAAENNKNVEGYSPDGNQKGTAGLEEILPSPTQVSQIVQESPNGVPWLSGLPGPVETSPTPGSPNEGHAAQAVITTTVSANIPIVTIQTGSGTAQIIPTITTNAGSGSFITTLPTTASGPLLTKSIPKPTTIIPVTFKATSRRVTPALGQTSANIFQPVETTSPPASFKSRTDHPASRVGVWPQSSPIGTNKFYGNLMAGQQESKIWTHPYSLAWARGISNSGSTQSYGMSTLVIHISMKI
jgi:hypothetical protein